MTNEDLIYYIQRMPRVFGIYGDHDLDYVSQIVNRIKSQEHENTKLKAEIEQLKWKLSSTETQRDLKGYDAKRNADIMSSQLKIIKQLKSELEQSVKLSCKLGDVIYFRVKGMNQFAEYVDFIQTQKITRIDIQEDGILYCSATEKFIESDINKTIFLSQEEAEQALKGQV